MRRENWIWELYIAWDLMALGIYKQFEFGIHVYRQYKQHGQHNEILSEFDTEVNRSR